MTEQMLGTNEVKDQMIKFAKSYEELDKTTQEMRVGRGQRVDKDIENRKAIVELQHEIKKIKKDREGDIRLNK